MRQKFYLCNVHKNCIFKKKISNLPHKMDNATTRKHIIFRRQTIIYNFPRFRSRNNWRNVPNYPH